MYNNNYARQGNPQVENKNIEESKRYMEMFSSACSKYISQEKLVEKKLKNKINLIKKYMLEFLKKEGVQYTNKSRQGLFSLQGERYTFRVFLSLPDVFIEVYDYSGYLIQETKYPINNESDINMIFEKWVIENTTPFMFK